MNSLIDQQRALQHAITSAGTQRGLLRGLGGREPMLGVYQHAYMARLIGALRDNFGVLPQVMGDEAFEALAAEYVSAHPSRHPSIRWFGDQLPAFMQANESLVPHPALEPQARRLTPHPAARSEYRPSRSAARRLAPGYRLAAGRPAARPEYRPSRSAARHLTALDSRPAPGHRPRR